MSSLLSVISLAFSGFFGIPSHSSSQKVKSSNFSSLLCTSVCSHLCPRHVAGGQRQKSNSDLSIFLRPTCLWSERMPLLRVLGRNLPSSYHHHHHHCHWTAGRLLFCCAKFFSPFPNLSAATYSSKSSECCPGFVIAFSGETVSFLLLLIWNHIRI